MGSIRPLITISIIIGVGVFLFTKINEGPVHLPHDEQGPSHAAPADAVADVPPLAPTTDTGPTALTPAPAWNGAAAESDTAATAAAPPLTPEPVAVTALPEVSTATTAVPPIPELPPVTPAEPSGLAAAPTVSPTSPTTIPTTNTTAGTPTSPTSDVPPIPLPANIPVAQYPGDAAAATAPAATSQSTAASVAEAAVPAAAAVGALAALPTAEATTAAAPAATSPVVAEPAAAPAAAVPSVATQAGAAASDDRYGALAAAAPVESTAPFDSTTPIDNTTPVAEASPPTTTAPPTALAAATTATATGPTFAQAWPEIQAALERQELVAAHEKLSKWYGNPTLTPAESQQVELLLSQLAGTVVYSTEHRLEPPYTVHPGDTLQTIAQKYEVPWQLLAKINGVASATDVQPGQQLKVVHGPFSAIVELGKSQLTLLVDGRYAGRFPVTLSSDLPVSEGKWVLEQKLVNPTTDTTGVVSASYTASSVDHVLVLRNEAAGTAISITGAKVAPSGPTAIAPAAIRLAPGDVEEVADILSVGSPVIVRR